MEITYKDGNVLVIHFEPLEMVGFFRKRKNSHKRRSYLMRLAINTNLPFPKKKQFFALFSRTKSFFFSLLQTTKLNLKWPKALQQL